jgi:hypothetical protein
MSRAVPVALDEGWAKTMRHVPGRLHAHTRRPLYPRSVRSAVFSWMCPARILPAMATTTTARETSVSIVRPMSAPVGIGYGSPLRLWRHAYMISGMARSEVETRGTAAHMEVDPHSALPAVSGPCRSCGVRLAMVALRFACPTSRRRRETPSGSVIRFTPLPAVGLVAPTRMRRDAGLSRNDARFRGVTGVAGVTPSLIVAISKA